MKSLRAEIYSKLERDFELEEKYNALEIYFKTQFPIKLCFYFFFVFYK